MKLARIPPDQVPVLERIRALCLALPGAVEEIKWGHPNWTVAKKIFAGYGFYADRPSLGTKQTLPDQALLCEHPPFFVSPYVGKHGWVSMWTDGKVDWGMAEELILRSYRLVAPKTLAASAGKAPGARTKAPAVKDKAKPAGKAKPGARRKA
jgi:predicted DNA-binding protein (MmcQ/YjbR family)